MNLPALIFIISGIALNAGAQLLLKAGANDVGQFTYTWSNALTMGWKLAMQPPILAGLACYIVSVVVWIFGLSRIDVSVAYPMLSMGYALNAVGAWWLLGEAISLERATAIGIILVGVYVLARSQ